MITSVQVGQSFPDLVHRGDVLPVGSVVTHDQRQTMPYIHQAPRTWVSKERGLIEASYLSYPWWIADMGGAEEVTLPPETARQFRWRLRDTALAAADRSGQPTGPVLEMVAMFGAPHPLLTVGGVVSNYQDIKALPPGSVVYSGHPDIPGVLSVWTMFEDGLRHTFGKARERSAGQPVTIYSMPGTVDEPLPIEVNDPFADEESLDRIAVRAWRIGRTFQRRNNWCSVFDQTLAALGITEKMLSSASGTVHGPGDTVTREQAALLPEGSLLWWQHRSHSGFAVYRRDDAARGVARTRRVFSYRVTEEPSHYQMTVISTPTEPMVWSVGGLWLAQLPDGTPFLDPRTRHPRVLDADTRSMLQTWMTYEVTGWVA